MKMWVGMLHPDGKHGQPTEGQADMGIETRRWLHPKMGEKKTIKALAAISADLKAVILAEPQKKIAQFLPGHAKMKRVELA